MVSRRVPIRQSGGYWGLCNLRVAAAWCRGVFLHDGQKLPNLSLLPAMIHEHLNSQTLRHVWGKFAEDL
jgi:hypothetical protein